MNHIDTVFSKLRENKKNALIPFITVGDPNIDVTVELILELEKNGVAMIELGVPFSDPLADGPVIQQASIRALQQHITVKDCIEVAGKARKRGCKLPFILFSYYNPILQFGLTEFITLMVDNNISGMIIPDLPMEEDEELNQIAIENGLYLIPLVAPTSKERVKQITSRANGFIYCVSSLGVTGERANFHNDVESFISTVKSSTSLPVVVGFGISNREQVERFSKLCDGVVVGSAIVRIIGELSEQLSDCQTRQKATEQIGSFVKQLS